MGGQGKSQIAFKYCRAMKEMPLWAIFWVDASSESTLKQDFELISESLKPKGVVLETTESKVNFVKITLDTWPNPWLMVFDSYDNPKTFDNVKDYMPENEKGKIIITSRHTDTNFLTDEKNRMELGGLLVDDAVELLFKQGMIKQRDQGTIDSAKEVVLRLGYHALAIAQAGSYIGKRKFPLSVFLAHFEKQKDEILGNTLPQLSDYRKRLSPSEKEKSLSVFATWELSYQQLQNEGIDAGRMADLLSLLAFFDSRDVSENLFQAYCNHKDATRATKIPSTSASRKDDQELKGKPASVIPSTASSAHIKLTIQAVPKGSIRDKTDRHHFPGVFLAQCAGKWDKIAYSGVVGTLTQLSLTQAFEMQEDGFYHVSLHRLIQDWIRLRTALDDSQKYSSIAATCIYRLLDITPYINGYDMPLSWQQSILAHLKVYDRNAEEFLSGVSPPFDENSHLGLPEFRIGNILNQNGQFSEAEHWFRESLRLTEQAHGTRHPETLTTMSNLGSVLGSQGKRQEAETMHRRVVQLMEQVLGKKHSATLTAMNNLALVLQDQVKYQEAEKIYSEVLQLSEHVGDKLDSNMLGVRNNLAHLLCEQGRYQEAEIMHQKTLKLMEQVQGKEHPDTLVSRNNLALTLGYQGKYLEAEIQHRQALQLMERVLGKGHLYTMRTMCNLGFALSSQCKYQEAEIKMQQALQLMEPVLGKKHPDTVNTIRHLVYMLESQGKLQEAECWKSRISEYGAGSVVDQFL